MGRGEPLHHAPKVKTPPSSHGARPAAPTGNHCSLTMEIGTTSRLLGLGLVCVLVYAAATAIYNVFFHPLRRFPGPRLWHSTFLFRHVANMQGRLDWSIKAFHDQYGDVVRFSPEELSFRTEAAWKDIHGRRDIVKDPNFYGVVKLGPDGAASIFNADAHNHPRVRKQLAHAFSEKALREQEAFIKGYVDLLIEKLHGVAAAGAPTDMIEWYNFTTFDLVGDMAIGKSFNCLRERAYHAWVNNLWKSVKIGPYLRTMATYTDIQRLVGLLAPKSIKEARRRHVAYVETNARERMAKGVMKDRNDFLSYILKNADDGAKALSAAEITANCGFLILAGSETTATALAGLTYHLLRAPAALQRVTAEVRAAFAAEADIDFVSASARLPYAQACITEGLRIYPPGPTLAPRRTPRGQVTRIDGYDVPSWTCVGVHALSATRSPANFHRAAEFVPERWLPAATEDPASPFFRDARGASQPFSLGGRGCLGKSLAHNELRVLLARILWNFDLELCAESEAWAEGQKTYTLWEKPPLMCRLRSRGRHAG